MRYKTDDERVKNIMITMPPDELDDLDVMAENCGFTRSRFIRNCIDYVIMARKCLNVDADDWLFVDENDEVEGYKNLYYAFVTFFNVNDPTIFADMR